MKLEIHGQKYNGKLINNLIIFYIVDDQLVKCSYKHQIKSYMYSDDQYFLGTTGIIIKNNRNNKDIAIVSDISF